MIQNNSEITSNVIDENKLLNEINKLKAILDSSLDGIMVFDSFYDDEGNITDFIFVMSNKEACRIVNLSEEYLIGKKLSETLSGNFKPLSSLNGKTLFENYKEIVLTGKSKSLEFYFESNGIKEWFKNKAVKYNDGFVCTFEVITKEKLFQEKLEKKVKEEIKKQHKQEMLLIQQSKMASMGEMIAAIAHNWRQPLNTVSLLSSVIFQKYINNNLNKKYLDDWISRMDIQISFMSQTIDDFRDFYNPNEKPKKIFIKNTIIKILSLINLQFDIINIKVKVDIPSNVSIICLENQFQQAIINILLNSREAIIDRNISHGKILISAKENSSFIDLIINDNAGGIKNKKILSSIFKPYFTTKSNINGTGLGLYMTKIIIEQNIKGKIEVNNVNNGLEFIIKIPR